MGKVTGGWEQGNEEGNSSETFKGIIIGTKWPATSLNYGYLRLKTGKTKT